MHLEELLGFHSIVILCHNNPDADAIASGYGLYLYFKEKGRDVRLAYGGNAAVAKSNLTLLINTYNIPIEYVTSLKEPDLLITADCQYGQGNVAPFSGKTVAVIDHHQVRDQKKLPALQEIHSNYGSCSTIVWQMLLQAGFDVDQNTGLSTALYYGLYTDTSKLQEISHPMDKDMRDTLKVDRSAIVLFQNSNLSLKELKITSRALERVDYRAAHRFAIVRSEPCDPNILGVISDMLIEVDVIDTCIVYCVLSGGAKLSVRSCVKETRADELAEAVANGLGSYGGHLLKAGGFLNKECLEDAFIRETRQNELPATENENWVHEILCRRMEAYFTEQEIIRAASYQADILAMQLYRKNPVSIGYVNAEDIFPAGTNILIRMLEGDFEITVCEGVQIMIGIEHEVYPSRREYVLNKYHLTEKPYLFEGEYSPTVRDTLTGEAKQLIPYAKQCTSKDASFVYAKEISCRTKVFTKWDKEKYMLGLPGDYLVASQENPKDIYIVKKEVFGRLYTKEP